MNGTDARAFHALRKIIFKYLYRKEEDGAS